MAISRALSESSSKHIHAKRTKPTEITKEHESNKRQSDTLSLVCLAVSQCQNSIHLRGSTEHKHSMHSGMLWTCKNFRLLTSSSSHLTEKEENLQTAEQKDTWGMRTRLQNSEDDAFNF